MPFADDVRRALAAPLGDPLQRIVRAGAITAIVTEGGDREREAVALGEMSRALAWAGVPMGRQFVLRASGAPPRPGPPLPRVLTHDPSRGAVFAAGALPDGTPVELDDELREAEGLVLMGRFAADAADGIAGGPAALWPGLAPDRGREAFAARLGGTHGAARTSAALALALAAHSEFPAGFALLWSGEEAPRIAAGEPALVFAACAADGWLAPR